MKRIFCLLAIFFCTFLVFEVSAQGEYATPKAGEGISAFLERNKRPGKACYNEFMKLNEKRLRGKEELRLGVKYILPPLKKGTSAAASSKSAAGKKGAVRERLFGKKLADVKVTSNRLQGACFYVVSGHGGPDPGAIGKIGKVELHEDEYAYDVALRLARNLMQEGADFRPVETYRPKQIAPDARTIEDLYSHIPGITYEDGYLTDENGATVCLMFSGIIPDEAGYAAILTNLTADNIERIEYYRLDNLEEPYYDGVLNFVTVGVNFNAPSIKEQLTPSPGCEL